MIRTDLDLIPAYGGGSSAPDAMVLSSNESTFEPLPSVREAVNEAGSMANRYPSVAQEELRDAIAAHAGHGLTRDNVAVGCGSSSLLLQAMQATCNPGQEVVYPWQSFEAYPILTRIANATPVPVPLTSDHANDLPGLLAAITEETSLLIVCNPNNPTGVPVSADAFVEFMDQVPKRVTVILDEAYAEFDVSDSPRGYDLLERYGNLTVMRTFSKAYGLAGMRIGYVVGEPTIIEAIARVGIPYSVSRAAEQAALASLEALPELELRVKETVDQRLRVLDAVDEDIRVPSETNFIFLPLKDRSREFADAMATQGIIVRCFDGDGVRVTITSAEETDRLLEALEAIGGTRAFH